MLLGVAIIATQIFSCKPKKVEDKDIATPTPTLVVPATYDSTTFKANTTTEKAVLTQLTNLVTEIKKGRVSGVTLDYAVLNNLYTTGIPSLKDLNTPYYNGKIYGADAWLNELTKASGNTYTPSDVITGQGGYFGKYLFEENGLEMEQVIEKGLFGSVLYNYLIKLITAPIDATTSDKILAILGANPSLPNSPNKSATNTMPDMALANYIARRDKNDGTGFYSQFSFNIRKLQAAVKGGANYTKERDEAIAAIKLIVEKANAATVINYCKAVTATMSQTTITDDQKGAALHAYGECVGFIHGWRTIPQSHKVISDMQIDEILVLLNAPYNATPTSYKFITSPVDELPKLQLVQNKLKMIYGFSDDQMTDFSKNWVVEKRR